MVDYRGPKLIRPIVERFELPFLHRVVSIHCGATDIADADIDRNLIQEFKQLESIEFRLRTQGSLSDADKTRLKSNVPDCRISAVVDSGAALRFKTSNGAFSMRCPN